MAQTFTPEADYIASKALRDHFASSFFFVVGNALPWEVDLEPPAPTLEIFEPQFFVPVSQLNFARRSSEGVRGSGRTRTGLEGPGWQITTADVEVKKDFDFTRTSFHLTHLAVEAVLRSEDWEGSFRMCALAAGVELQPVADNRPTYVPDLIKDWGMVVWLSSFPAVHWEADRHHRFRVLL